MIYGNQSSDRVDMLHACLVACRSYFDIFLAFLPDSFFSIPMSTFGQMTLDLASFFKLALLEAPGWDLRHVRRELDVSLLPDLLVRRFEDALRAIGPIKQINSTDAFSRYAQRFRQSKCWYSTNLTAGSGPELSQELMSASWTKDFEVGDQCDFLETYW